MECLSFWHISSNWGKTRGRALSRLLLRRWAGMASFLVSFGIAIWRGIILKSWRRSLSLKNWDHIPILSALLQSYSMSWKISPNRMDRLKNSSRKRLLMGTHTSGSRNGLLSSSILNLVELPMNTSSSREPFCKNWRLRESPKSLLWEPAVLPVWSNTSENKLRVWSPRPLWARPVTRQKRRKRR